jgi:hypothetical protein
VRTGNIVGCLGKGGERGCFIGEKRRKKGGKIGNKRGLLGF